MDPHDVKKSLLQELHLIQCSLLPDEHLAFLDEPQGWLDTLATYAADPMASSDSLNPGSEVRFSLRVDGARLWFEITLSEVDHDGGRLGSLVSVKGEDISRDEQERWQSIIAGQLKDLKECDTEFLFYELLSVCLLPLVHEELERRSNLDSEEAKRDASDKVASSPEKEIYHALFTSHHLISPNKRRSLQNWSSSLSLTGFAKVGYPGVIYAEGQRPNIEEFVDSVKAMQWLALKLRFVEPLPKSKDSSALAAGIAGRSWKEFEKVGEVVEEMRRLGREEYVVEMGIGSAGTK
ncbi:hypothetical protein GALMADRAFT_54140 [Galerina marginata CBS 339.88]|uniref:Small nuclear ribonucleoprotein Prp3 C-terminal domain-containing protein n=1 Tax=Galerina marginata (strain CBS 339.88) TaxID=685588 RepID=A0A067U1D5_GALM3|nr:hypothetical protein GALMADRAFT_54140 [Galerina marginata CBS 339.88]